MSGGVLVVRFPAMKQATAPRGRVRRLSSVRSRSATIDKASYLVSLHLRSRGDVVLVYSMPKVASSTIRRAIVESTHRPALHFHNMTRQALAADKEWWREHSDDHHTSWQWRGEYARHRVRFGRPRGKWDIVNGVREPIARSVSALFQVGEREGFLDPETSPDEVDLGPLRERFLTYFTGQGDWFRDELEPATGLNVYARPFDWAAGYGTVENDRFRSMTIRQEDLARVGAPAIGEFLGCDDVALPRRNAAEEKFYHSLYTRFGDEVQLPESLVDKAYSSEQARHFYSPAELNEFRARWLD
jgi:hypothetical protein